MEIKLVNEKGQLIDEPHQIRLYGWTEERYFKEAPRDRKCEFVKGDLILMTPMSEDHSDVATFLSFLLRGYCDTKDLGKLLTGPTIRIELGINREPDLCFFPKEGVC